MRKSTGYTAAPFRFFAAGDTLANAELIEPPLNRISCTDPPTPRPMSQTIPAPTAETVPPEIAIVPPAPSRPPPMPAPSLALAFTTPPEIAIVPPAPP